jgi:hypothetical protein
LWTPATPAASRTSAPGYQVIKLPVQSDRPFILNFSVHPYAPIYFDAVVLNSPALTLKAVEKVAADYYDFPKNDAFERLRLKTKENKAG